MSITHDAKSIDGASADLGGGGMRLVAKENFEAGSDLTLRFTLPGAVRDTVTKARVVISFFDAASRKYAHGIAFTQISGTDQAAIVEFIHKRQGYLSPKNP